MTPSGQHAGQDHNADLVEEVRVMQGDGTINRVSVPSQPASPEYLEYLEHKDWQPTNFRDLFNRSPLEHTVQDAHRHTNHGHPCCEHAGRLINTGRFVVRCGGVLSCSSCKIEARVIHAEAKRARKPPQVEQPDLMPPQSDLDMIVMDWLWGCGIHDYGMPPDSAPCVCDSHDSSDPRPVISSLVDEVRRLRKKLQRW